MESASHAGKYISRNLQSQFRKWTLKRLRSLVWFLDEWIHRQEIAMRQDAAREQLTEELHPVASAARERAAVCRPRAKRIPRLKYQHGEFVRMR